MLPHKHTTLGLAQAAQTLLGVMSSIGPPYLP
jgi:hypothetical protein